MQALAGRTMDSSFRPLALLLLPQLPPHSLLACWKLKDLPLLKQPGRGVQIEAQNSLKIGLAGPPQDRAAAAERAFAAAEEKVVDLRRQLAAAKLHEGDQPPEVSDLKRRIADLQAESDDKVRTGPCAGHSLYYSPWPCMVLGFERRRKGD